MKHSCLLALGALLSFCACGPPLPIVRADLVPAWRWPVYDHAEGRLTGGGLRAQRDEGGAFVLARQELVEQIVSVSPGDDGFYFQTDDGNVFHSETFLGDVSHVPSRSTTGGERLLPANTLDEVSERETRDAYDMAGSAHFYRNPEAVYLGAELFGVAGGFVDFSRSPPTARRPTDTILVSCIGRAVSVQAVGRSKFWNCTHDGLLAWADTEAWHAGYFRVGRRSAVAGLSHVYLSGQGSFGIAPRTDVDAVRELSVATPLFVFPLAAGDDDVVTAFATEGLREPRRLVALSPDGSTESLELPEDADEIGFANRRFGVVVDDARRLHVTVDGGESWRELELPSGGHTRSLPYPHCAIDRCVVGNMLVHTGPPLATRFELMAPP